MTKENLEPMQPTSETLGAQPSFELIVARHAEYHMDESRPDLLGRLTDAGKNQASELGRQVIEKAHSMGGKIDITFIASSQLYDSPDYPMYEQGGKRAEETADQALTQIMASLPEEIDQEDIRLTSPLYKQKPEIPFSHRLVEGDIYYLPFKPGSSDLNDRPTAYVDTLRQRHGKNWKEVHLQGSDEEAEDTARHIGAETSAGVAQRTMSVVRDLSDLARHHAENEPDRKLLVVLVAHDGVIRSLVQNELGVREDSFGYLPRHAESVSVHVDNGQAITDFNGQQYRVPFDPHATISVK